MPKANMYDDNAVHLRNETNTEQSACGQIFDGIVFATTPADATCSGCTYQQILDAE